MQIQYKTKYEQQAQNQLQNKLQNQYQINIKFQHQMDKSITLKNEYICIYIFNYIYIVYMYKLELLQPLANIVFAIEELHKHDKSPFSKGTCSKWNNAIAFTIWRWNKWTSCVQVE